MDQVYSMCLALQMTCWSCLHWLQESHGDTERPHKLEVKLKMVTHLLNRQQMERTHRWTSELATSYKRQLNKWCQWLQNATSVYVPKTPFHLPEQSLLQWECLQIDWSIWGWGDWSGMQEKDITIGSISSKGCHVQHSGWWVPACLWACHVNNLYLLIYFEMESEI